MFWTHVAVVYLIGTAFLAALFLTEWLLTLWAGKWPPASECSGCAGDVENPDETAWEEDEAD